MERLGRLIAAFCRMRSGATSIEYAMIGGIISIAIVAGARAIGVNLTTLFLNKVLSGFS